MPIIKFRACIPTLGKYCFGGNGLTLNEIRRLGEGYFREDILWLQYTGKNDTTNKEIYDKDVLDGGLDRVGLVTWDDDGAQWVVLWQTTHLDRRRKATYYTNRLHQLASRVIGNIIENPNLLNMEAHNGKRD